MSQEKFDELFQSALVILFLLCTIAGIISLFNLEKDLVMIPIYMFVIGTCMGLLRSPLFLGIYLGIVGLYAFVGVFSIFGIIINFLSYIFNV